jgi:hypothetical protein
VWTNRGDAGHFRRLGSSQNFKGLVGWPGGCILTTVRPPLELNPNGHTVLLGWSPDFHVFGGFDLSRHQNFRPGSNSVQISRQTLLAAQNFGWGFYSNQFGEIAIAFRPSEFINYVTNATALHTGGEAEMQLFNRIARDGQVQPAVA